MQLLRKRIVADTITKDSETFDVNNVVSFTVNNIGASDCIISYQGGPRLMMVEKGTAREFPGDSGYTYYGVMQIHFVGNSSGMVEIIKSVTTTEES